jgi:DNA-binding LacI/PurR family transcriptional regulator
MRRREFITLTAWAQQPSGTPLIGVLMGYAENDLEAKSWIAGFVEGLKKLGWIEGSNVRIEYRWATGKIERLRTYAAELLGLKPDVILAASTPALAAIFQQTRSVPIVFVNVADPIGQALVPLTTNAPQQTASLFDHLVGGGEQGVLLVFGAPVPVERRVHRLADLAERLQFLDRTTLFGWSGGGMASLYTRAADRARLGQRAAEKLLKNDMATSIPSPDQKVRDKTQNS